MTWSIHNQRHEEAHAFGCFVAYHVAKGHMLTAMNSCFWIGGAKLARAEEIVANRRLWAWAYSNWLNYLQHVGQSPYFGANYEYPKGDPKYPTPDKGERLRQEVIKLDNAYASAHKLFSMAPS